MATPNAQSMAKFVALLEQQKGVLDFPALLKLWASETQPDLGKAIERFIHDSDNGDNTASAIMLMIALAFEAGRVTEVGILYLESIGKWPKRTIRPH